MTKEGHSYEGTRACEDSFIACEWGAGDCVSQLVVCNDRVPSHRATFRVERDEMRIAT